MRKCTVQDAIDFGIHVALGLCSDSTDVLRLINEAQWRAWCLPIPFVGKKRRFQFCVSNNCITYPRQIATIDKVWICRQPIPVRSIWFESLDTGYGIRQDGDIDLQHFDRDNGHPTFADITGEKLISIFTDVAEDAGTYIWLYGYDENDVWIQTTVDGTLVDGERIDLSTANPAGVMSSNTFTALTSVKKAVTKSNVRLYQYDTGTATQTAIAIYEPDETNPDYRRAYIPGLSDLGACCEDEDVDCAEKKVTVMATLEFIPARSTTDFLMINNLPALKEMAMAVKYGEQDSAAEKQKIEFHEARCRRLLNDEYDIYCGVGGQQDVRVIRAENTGAGDIESMI